MTVTSIVNRWSYTADGITTSFTFDNLIFADADLKVYVESTLKTLGTDYTVAGAGSPSGGMVNFVAAPASGEVIAIVREVPFTQTLDLAPLGSFPAEELEKALDRTVILSHQLLDGRDRTIRQPESDVAPIGVLPPQAARAGQYLAFDANGDPMASSGTTTPAISPFMATLVDDGDAAAARATLGLGTAAIRDDHEFVTPDDLEPIEASVDALAASRSAIQVAFKYAGY